MFKKLNLNFYDSLFVLLPLSIILGPTISLINVFLFIIIYFLKYFKKAHLNYVMKNNTIILLFLLNIYLIFNTLVSIDPSSGYLEILALLDLYFFLLLLIIYFTLKGTIFPYLRYGHLFFIVVFDVYFERLSGTNIFGFGSEEEDFGPRIVSFLKTNLSPVHIYTACYLL